MTGPVARTRPHSGTRSRGWVRARQVLGPLISLALIAWVFVIFLPQFTSLSAAWAAARAMTLTEVGLLAAAAAWNLATYWFVMTSTMPGLTHRQAAVVTEASTAVSNTIPGGGAIGLGISYAMYDSWGFSRSRSSVSLLVSGIWNNFAKLGLPVLALALLAISGNPSGGRLIAGISGFGALIAAVVILAMVLRSERAARRIGLVSEAAASSVMRLLRQPPVTGWDRATTKFRTRTILLLRARWQWITLATVVSHLSLYLVLLTALRSVGVSEREVSWIQVLTLFAFARLITAIPFSPGGLGVVELVLISGLAAAGGSRPEVAAAVLIFRALTYVLPIPLGVAAYLWWRRNSSWRREPNAAPRTALVPEVT